MTERDWPTVGQIRTDCDMSDILAWHFVGNTLRDRRPIPPDGELLRYDGPLVMCESGLHASERIIDALQYAPGETVCRVRCGGKIIGDDDKLICRERTILWRLNVEQLLREFARRCAMDVVHLWNAPQIVLDYLRTGGESKRAAAWAAARDATNAAANAARDAAWAAANAAARGAAMDAARDAARAARGAARDAAMDAQNKRLTEMVECAHKLVGTP